MLVKTGKTLDLTCTTCLVSWNLFGLAPKNPIWITWSKGLPHLSYVNILSAFISFFHFLAWIFYCYLSCVHFHSTITLFRSLLKLTVIHDAMTTNQDWVSTCFLFIPLLRVGLRKWKTEKVTQSYKNLCINSSLKLSQGTLFYLCGFLWLILSTSLKIFTYIECSLNVSLKLNNI